MTKEHTVYSNSSAAEQNLASCHLCSQLSIASESKCPRCGEPLHLRKPESITRTLALTITALLLYIPANLIPIMNTASFGNEDPSTIIGGVILLWQLESYPVALVILLASVFVPSGKMAALFYLCWSVNKGPPTEAQKRTVVYRITEMIGRWSMVDVFVVSILVALVQLGGLITILPGFGAVFFCGVVIITIFAAESFDSRLIWDQTNSENSESTNTIKSPSHKPSQDELSYE
jgi:paraquat-inducible protein A